MTTKKKAKLKDKRYNSNNTLKKNGIEYDGSTPLENYENELFCQYYINGNGDTYGHITASYLFVRKYHDLIKNIEDFRNNPELVEDFMKDKSNVNYRNYASNMYNNKDVQLRIIWLLQNNDRMTDLAVDSEMEYVIKQRYDLSAKMRGISEYNKIKNRIKERLEVTVNEQEKNPLIERLEQLKNKKKT